MEEVLNSSESVRRCYVVLSGMFVCVCSKCYMLSTVFNQSSVLLNATNIECRSSFHQQRR